jgi:hypothetical protein
MGELMARDLGAELAFGCYLRKSRGKVSERKAEVQPGRCLQKRRIIGREWDKKSQYGERKKQTNRHRHFAISYNLIEMYYLRGL